jgi:hypothetical protein
MYIIFIEFRNIHRDFIKSKEKINERGSIYGIINSGTIKD